MMKLSFEIVAEHIMSLAYLHSIALRNCAKLYSYKFIERLDEWRYFALPFRSYMRGSK